MEKIGIYLTDASFDKKSKISSISFIEKNSNKTSNKQTNEFQNIFEAEYEGIRLCLIHGFKKYKNIIVVCDNRGAIFKAQRDLRIKMNLRSRFDSCQFIWLPREYLEEVDFLTKNVDIHLNKKLKIENCTTGNILDIFLTKSDYVEILEDLISQFKNENLYLDRVSLKIFHKILNGIVVDPLNYIEDLAFDIKIILKNNPKEGKKDSTLQRIIKILYLV